MQYYFEQETYQWLIDTYNNKICVSIKNQHYEEFNITLSFVEEQFKFNCSCCQEKCFHVQFLIYMLNQNYEKKLHHHYFNFDEDVNHYLYIPLKGSSNDTYGVEIKVDSTKTFTYYCSCGLKYTRKKRKKCKHIKQLLHTLLNTYNEEHNISIEELICFEDLSI